MPLNLEPIIAEIEARLRDALPTALATVANAAARSLPLPSPRDYFWGEPFRYHAYKAPAVFLWAEVTTRPTEQTANVAASMLYQEHALRVVTVVEAQTEDLLTRTCWRYAEAIDACLRDYEMEASDSSRVYSVLVLTIAHGGFVDTGQAANRVFRRDVAVNCRVLHWDRLRMS